MIVMDVEYYRVIVVYKCVYFVYVYLCMCVYMCAYVCTCLCVFLLFVCVSAECNNIYESSTREALRELKFAKASGETSAGSYKLYPPEGAGFKVITLQ